ncbi:tRNA epoxyqueuosine(34) reductase QueG [soil metagenome]
MAINVRYHQPAEPFRFAVPEWVELQNHSPDHELSLAKLREMAESCGLGISAVTPAQPFRGLQEMLTAHIEEGRLAGLDWYDQDRAAVASDPNRLHSNAKSVIALGVPFFTSPPAKPQDEPRGRVARYAWGADYHKVLRKRMQALHERLEAAVGRTVESRLLSDTARIVDRAVSARAGLGWYGKHSCIIVPGYGSWVMLAEMIVDIVVEASPPIDHDCGICSICIGNCPTGAIVAPYMVDTPQCLSFQTIEQRGAIPMQLRSLMGDWVFGCDVCQDVCPYTSAAKQTFDKDFQPRELDNAFPRLHWLLTMTGAEFRQVFQGTAVLRAKRRGLARNAAVALGNLNDPASMAVLVDAVLGHDEPLVRSHAAWALGQFGDRRSITALDRARSTETDTSVLSEIEAALDR